MQSPSEYWAGNSKLLHITPPGERYPETGLFPILQSVVKGSVTEFGCGDGRLAQAFAASSYLGCDINEHALQAARKNNQQHTFTNKFSPSDTFLAHTVLLHIPDDEIDCVISKAMQSKTIVISEIMGRKWRRGGNPPVFNREAKEYEQMIGARPEAIEIPYPRYNCNLTMLVFTL